MKKTIFIICTIVVVLAAVGEIVLRVVWGFCDAPLFVASDNYEYIAAPNQSRYRFRAHSWYNSFSQRCDEPNPSKKKVLGLGDSVLYGGTLIDQDSIASTLFSTNADWQMLNISAGSWGPDNCAAYLRENGFFNAQAMYLVVSSHDAHDVMDFTPVVGVHPTYPDKEYAIAWWELLDRYFLPRLGILFKNLKKAELDPDQKVVEGIRKKNVGFNPGFDELKAMADSVGIPLYVYLHAELCELQKGAYNSQGEEIIQWCHQNSVPLTLELERGIKEDMYRDAIHFNEKGQRFLYEQMCKDIMLK